LFSNQRTIWIYIYYRT